jgi:cellulose synthase/poly-beta-1,6-N-acetylglucosamine synthase-like glycosyltransferase
VYDLGHHQGDVRVGDIIVQLDKDSVMPPDVIRATVPEFLADRRSPTRSTARTRRTRSATSRW